MLAKLETRLAHVCNLSLRAKEWNGDLVFLHEARPGPADRSYGVQVAKLAGILGLNVQDVGAQQTGMTVEAFKARLLSAAED